MRRETSLGLCLTVAVVLASCPTAESGVVNGTSASGSEEPDEPASIPAEWDVELPPAPEPVIERIEFRCGDRAWGTPPGLQAWAAEPQVAEHIGLIIRDRALWGMTAGCSDPSTVTSDRTKLGASTFLCGQYLTRYGFDDASTEVVYDRLRSISGFSVSNPSPHVIIVEAALDRLDGPGRPSNARELCMADNSAGRANADVVIELRNVKQEFVPDALTGGLWQVTTRLRGSERCKRHGDDHELEVVLPAAAAYRWNPVRSRLSELFKAVWTRIDREPGAYRSRFSCIHVEDCEA